MRAAFEANFPNDEVPETFAGPCCAQFAVTREAIQRNPRTQYARSQSWLVNHHIGHKVDNQIPGRIWEHLWPWLFLNKAPKPFQAQATSDCPSEWDTYCGMYGVCFGNAQTGSDEREAASEYNARWAEKEALRRDHLEEWWNRLLHPFRAAKAARTISEIDEELDQKLLVALERGKDPKLRDRAFADMFPNKRQSQHQMSRSVS